VQSLSDKELLEQLRLGSPSAFAQLYQRYKHRVYAYCNRLLRDEQSAEDAVQETFLKIHHSLHLLQKPEMFRPWLFSIARNEAYTHLRRTKHVENLENEEEVVWEENNPLDAVIETDTKDIIQHYLGLLKPYYRELLILREYEQLSYTEIARITGLTESAVKSGLFKARKALGKKLGPILDESKSYRVLQPTRQKGLTRRNQSG
jgi:RNA polymerase sigma-70 factor (ECF subfamily)